LSGRLEGKVALVTGAARGQGRSHAIRLAQEGAHVIAVDICEQIESVPYAMATPEDLIETVRQVEGVAGRIIATKADVRDFQELQAAVESGVAEFGRLDIVSANAAIVSMGPSHDLEEQQWQDVLATNLTGVWHTAKAAIPHIKAGGRGGSIILTSSSAALRAHRNVSHYLASKHGVIGLMRGLALELGPEMIRVNSIHPGAVNTPMNTNPRTYSTPSGEEPQYVRPDYEAMNVLPITWAEPVDISNALIFLASDEGRYITGVALPVDAGTTIK